MTALAIILGVVAGAVAIIVAAELAVLADNERDGIPPSCFTYGDEP
ncbi:hypothetical protein LNAOJCKE_0910 [Methylorubrum aminovorans]|uniref:Uncharacterized protein n=1 Tax=Methylorubrum aminovorans TaxID=269069 RepID=A0ABQ4UB77_9HYPH|nr:hypothetical protein [Methylorubrum aminovorans]GJE63712.1 hypothetical protein LNAOJCKE_0910 [Methylorubrum aminovorans]GMA73643.1 hypothetical protein GCM10025880_00600 [Methylorubrum aminovorans]GMA79829.1 hypothetical protein GCM10025880_62460 [Methylorubrum aminovorans]